MGRIENRIRPGKTAALAFVSLLVSAAQPAFAFNCHVDPKIERDFYWGMTPAAMEAQGDLDIDAYLAEQRIILAAHGQIDPNGVIFLRRGEDINRIIDVSTTPVFLGRAAGNSSETFPRYTCGNTITPEGNSLSFSGFERGRKSLDFDAWAGSQLAYRNWIMELEAAPETWVDHNRAQLRIDAPKLDFSLSDHNYSFVIDEADVGIAFDTEISGGPGTVDTLNAAAITRLIASGVTPLHLQARRVLGRLFTDSLPPEDPNTYPAEFDDLAAAKPGRLRTLEGGFRSQPVNVAQTPYYYGSIRIQTGRESYTHNHNGLGFYIDGDWVLHALSVDGAEAEIDLRPWISRQSGNAYYMSFEVSDPVIDVDMGSSHLRLVASEVTLMLDKKDGTSVFSIAADVFSDDPTPPVPAAKT